MAYQPIIITIKTIRRILYIPEKIEDIKRLNGNSENAAGFFTHSLPTGSSDTAVEHAVSSVSVTVSIVGVSVSHVSVSVSSALSTLYHLCFRY